MDVPEIHLPKNRPRGAVLIGIAITAGVIWILYRRHQAKLAADAAAAAAAATADTSYDPTQSAVDNLYSPYGSTPYSPAGFSGGPTAGGYFYPSAQQPMSPLAAASPPATGATNTNTAPPPTTAAVAPPPPPRIVNPPAPPLPADTPINTTYPAYIDPGLAAAPVGAIGQSPVTGLPQQVMIAGTSGPAGNTPPVAYDYLPQYASYEDEIAAYQAQSGNAPTPVSSYPGRNLPPPPPAPIQQTFSPPPPRRR